MPDPEETSGATPDLFATPEPSTNGASANGHGPATEEEKLRLAVEQSGHPTIQAFLLAKLPEIVAS